MTPLQGPGGHPAPDPPYREELRAALEEMLEGTHDTRPGLMFGFPAFYAGDKLVACVYGAGIGVRVTPEEATEIRGEATPAFEPYGRIMKTWAFLEPAVAEDLRAEAPVFEAAMDRAKREGEGRSRRTSPSPQ